MSDRDTPAGAERAAHGKTSSKLLKIFILFLLAVIIAAGAAAAVFFGLFRVKTFSVKGEMPYSENDIIDISGINPGDRLFLLDYERAQKRLETVLPYLDDVKITKKLPSTIIISAKKAKQTYSVALSGGAFAVTDENLKVLEITAGAVPGTMSVEGYNGLAAAPGEVLSFAGDGEADEVREALGEISRAVEESGIQGVDLINIENRSAVYILYGGRIIIRLGNTQDMLKKLSLAQKAINEENKLSSSQFGELNVVKVGKANFLPKDYKDMPELKEYYERGNAAEEGEDEAGEDAQASGESGYDDENGADDYDGGYDEDYNSGDE